MKKYTHIMNDIPRILGRRRKTPIMLLILSLFRFRSGAGMILVLSSHRYTQGSADA